MSWAKVKFYFDNMIGQVGSTLTATSTALGDYDVNYIGNWLEGYGWKAASAASPCDITLYTGLAGEKNVADYLGIQKHNLGSISATLALQVSDDGTTWADVTTFMPIDDKPIVKEFITPIIDNGGFEQWDAGAPVRWSATNATMAQETTNTASGVSALLLTHTAGASGYAKQTLGHLDALQGKTITLGVKVKCSVASIAYIQVKDGVSTGTSSYHTGNGEFQWLTASITVSNTAAFVETYNVLASIGDTAVFDSAVLVIGSSAVEADFFSYQPSIQYRLHEYRRLRITGQTAAPEIAVMAMGQKTELDYVDESFDPNYEDDHSNVNLSDTGYLLGVHTKWVERQLKLVFSDISLSRGTQYRADGTYAAAGSITGAGSQVTTLYDKLRDWRDRCGLSNFFVAWEGGEHPDDVYLMHADPKFDNPLKLGGAYRDITINLSGRKE